MLIPSWILVSSLNIPSVVSFQTFKRLRDRAIWFMFEPIFPREARSWTRNLCSALVSWLDWSCAGRRTARAKIAVEDAPASAALSWRAIHSSGVNLISKRLLRIFLLASTPAWPALFLRVGSFFFDGFHWKPPSCYFYRASRSSGCGWNPRYST